MNPEIIQKLHKLKMEMAESLSRELPYRATRRDLEVLQSAIDIIELFASMGRLPR